MGLNEKFFKSASGGGVPVGDENFAPTIWTGNDTARNISTNFAPDFVWIKSRSAARNHYLYDSVRSANNQLLTNATSGQANIGERLTAFNSDSFRLGTSAEVNNASTEKYVGWAWKAGGAAIQNNDGSITGANCLVSANQNAGFSITKYIGNGTQGATIGHGLATAPALIIWKNISATSNWLVYSPLIGNDSQWLYLNLATSSQTSGSQNEYPTNKTNPTSSVVTVNGSGSSNNINISGQSIAMYSFANVSGYQKIGTYVGTETTNPVYTTDNGASGGANGFEPRFVMIKSVGTVQDWHIFDNERLTSVGSNIGTNAKPYLRPNSTGQENAATNATVTFNSNNFTVLGGAKSLNEEFVTFLYLAIA